VRASDHGRWPESCPNLPLALLPPDRRPELLARLTTLAQELAGAFRPATVIELVARALAELLKPDRLSVILLDAESNRLAVTYDTHPVPARTDDPLLQLALRRGPLAFPKDVREEAAVAGRPARRCTLRRLLAWRTPHRRGSHDGRGVPLERAARRAG